MAVNINVPSQVRTFANLAAFPASGAVKTIYIAEDTNKTYRWDGSTYVEISASAATGLTIGTTPIASGTVGRVLFEGAGNVLQESANLFWNNTNGRLGIGTSTPAHNLAVKSSSLISTIHNQNSGIGGQYFITNGSEAAYMTGGASFNGTSWVAEATSAVLFGTFLGDVRIYANKSLTTGNTFTPTERFAIFGSTGNVGINTTTDAGFRLDVNGTARVQNTLTVTKGASNFFSIEPSANGTAPYIQGFFAGFTDSRIYFDTGFFKLRSAGASSTLGLDCGSIFSNGNIELVGSTQQKVKIAGTTNNFIQFTQAGISNRGTIGYATGQSFMQIRVNAASDLTDGTFSTAFFSTGNVGINTTTDAGFKLDVNGTARVTGGVTSGVALVGTWSIGGGLYARFGHSSFNIGTTFGFIQQNNGDCFMNGLSNFISASTNNIFETNGAERMRITSSGNVLIGTTTNGASRLRVVGLPTSPVGLSSGDVWNNLGILTIV
jgi:hypothetical protein